MFLFCLIVVLFIFFFFALERSNTMDSMYNFANNQTVINQIETAASDVDTLNTETIILALGLVPAVEVVPAAVEDRLDITFDEGECEPLVATNEHGKFVYIKTAARAKVRSGDPEVGGLNNFTARIDVVQHYNRKGEHTGTLAVLMTEEMNKFTMDAMVDWNHYRAAINCSDEIEFLNW
jgi:hypothetical protein